MLSLLSLMVAQAMTYLTAFLRYKTQDTNYLSTTKGAGINFSALFFMLSHFYASI